jgi:uncharacterized protein (DUF697 family)
MARKDPQMAQKPQASASIDKVPEKDAEKVHVTTAASSPAADIPESEWTPERRAEMAEQLVDRFALWSGVAGLIPLAGVDILTVGGIQVQMLRRLSQIYGVPFSENRGKAFIASLAGSMIPASSALGAASALKIVPIFGTLISAFVMPTLSAGATYAIGKVFIQHFATGGTFLDFHAPNYREFFKAQKQKWGSRRAPKSASFAHTDSTMESAATSP